eukprot:TRINITY_DN11137_c0_g2_i2.p1 TRINITY_DN11137_c0_g2~~TRINITY_DN11137_c0_g2_i2.p1  ORF type:complete len:452 (+),score=88.05 TRINITY_DN11137_c0_g2_i2:76-1431(+)
MPTVLVLDGVPASVQQGEVFTVAVLVQDADSGDPDTEFSDPVTLALAAGDGALGGTVTVNASYGEALFDDLTYNGVEEFAIVASAGDIVSDSSDAIQVEAAAGAAGGEGGAEDDEDELLADVPLLVSKLCDPSTSVVKQKHYAYLLKSRLWNSEQNRERLLEMKAASKLLQLIARSAQDEDMLIKLLPVMNDLFTFTGAIRYTCSNSHGVIKEFPFVRTTHDGATKNWLPACFQCAATKEPIFGDWPPKTPEALRYQIHDHLPYKMGKAPDGAVTAEAIAFHPRVVTDPGAGNAFRQEACEAGGVQTLHSIFTASLADEYLRDKAIAALAPLLDYRPEELTTVLAAAPAGDAAAEAACLRILVALSSAALRAAPQPERVLSLLDGAAAAGLPQHITQRAAELAAAVRAGPAPGRSPLVARLPGSARARLGLRALSQCAGAGAVYLAAIAAM